MSDSTQRPLVSIVMGSASDLRVMQAAADTLRAFEVPHELDIVSAHRTPDKLHAYAGGLLDRGIEVVIAGAGGAAHLPGMIAAKTVVPVIGVPVAATKLEGMDALLSIVQMPAGVPVATVAIDNAENAALLATQIVALHLPAVRARLLEHKRTLADRVLTTAAATATVYLPDLGR
ncbi:MAG: 5-(carboxyamino)imidazole ribonucleotide mutase [Gammaproteobacteria bacterium]